MHRQALTQSLNATSVLNIYYLYTLSILLYYTDSRKVIYFIYESRKMHFKNTVHIQIFLFKFKIKI